MASEETDEIGEIVARVNAESAENATPDDLAPETKEKPKPRRRARKKKEDEKASSPKTLAELGAAEVKEKLPTPEEAVKGLEEMYAKFGVGERPDFKIHLYRTYPKIAPGGMKFDGFYDEYDYPISEQQIQADYGGGQYRVTVMGPNPRSPNMMKHYASRNVSIAGKPNYERVPRALQGQEKTSDGASNNPPPSPMGYPAQNPKLVEVSMKMMERAAERDREERLRMEEKIESRSGSIHDASMAVAAAERRRADDMIRATQERAEAERMMLERRSMEDRERSESERRRVEMEQRSRPSIGSELQGLADMGLFNRDDGVAKEMLTQVLSKHRDEMASVQQQHGQFVVALREGHAAEIAALRSAHAREMAAEREASKAREGRAEERLGSEREERERDRNRNRETIEDRDRQAKDRQEQALQLLRQSWESRIQALTTSYETKEQWHKTEIEKLRGELSDLKMRQEEKGDIFTQLAKYKEMGSLLKEMGGGASATPTAAGIGISGMSEDWRATAVEGLVEHSGQILEKIFGGSQGSSQGTQQGQGQPAYVEGQFHQTAQGLMEVVRDPQSGQLALAPKAAMDQHRAAQAQAQGQGGGLLGSPPQQQRPRHRAPQRPHVSVTPNMAEGLPRPRPPWEGGGSEEEAVQSPQPPPPPPPAPPVPARMTTRRPEVTSSVLEPIEMTSAEKQGIRMIAKAVHDSVMEADEPEDFVQKILAQYPPAILRQAVGSYTDQQIVRGITQVEPNSAGATPAGQQFVARAFGLLRHAVSQ